MSAPTMEPDGVMSRQARGPRRKDGTQAGTPFVRGFDELDDEEAAEREHIMEADDRAEEAPKGATGRTVISKPTQPRKVAAEVVEHLGDQLRYHRKSWMLYRATHWAEVGEDTVRELIYRFTEDAVYLRWEPQEKTHVETDWDPNRSRVDNVLDAARGLALLSDEAQLGSWLDGRDDQRRYVPVLNGLVDVATGQLHPHDAAYFSTTVIPLVYDPDAPEPVRWLEFLGQVFPDDKDAIALLQEWFGYILSGDTRQQKLLAMIGKKRSGKGTVARVLAALLGGANTCGTSLGDLSKNFGLSDAIGKSLLVAGDARLAGQSQSVVIERLLSITGEDEIQVDRKHRQPWNGRLSCRIMILSNEVPGFVDHSGALAVRVMFLHTKISHEGKEDPYLTDKLLAELSGIFNWALAGLSRLTENGRFTQPESSRVLANEFADSSSGIEVFLDDCCVEGATEMVDRQLGYEAYRIWSRRMGQPEASMRGFLKQLRSVRADLVTDHRPGDSRTAERPRHFLGLSLQPLWFAEAQAKVKEDSYLGSR